MVTFTGLPASNSDFGTKPVEVKCDGDVHETSDIEVFFPRDATNNPGGSDPSWFYYWRQVRDNANMTYNSANASGGSTLGITQWNYAAAPDKDDTEIGTQNPGSGREYGVGELMSGIDKFINNIHHEECHVSQIARADPLVPSTGADSRTSADRRDPHRVKMDPHGMLSLAKKPIPSEMRSHVPGASCRLTVPARPLFERE